MALEKYLLAVSSQPLTSDGTTSGIAALDRPDLFKTRQIIIIQSDNDPALTLQVKRVNLTTIEIGPVDVSLTTRADISAYTVADNSTISATEQLRPFVPNEDPEKLSFETDTIEHEEEPTNAKRVSIVDTFGRKISSIANGLIRLAVSALLDPFTSFADGSKTVALIGTPEAVDVSSSIKAILVQAKFSNTTSIFVGTVSSQNVELNAGDSETFLIDDPSKIFVRVQVNGEGVNFHTLA